MWVVSFGLRMKWMKFSHVGGARGTLGTFAYNSEVLPSHFDPPPPPTPPPLSIRNRNHKLSYNGMSLLLPSIYPLTSCRPTSSVTNKNSSACKPNISAPVTLTQQAGNGEQTFSATHTPLSSDTGHCCHTLL